MVPSRREWTEPDHRKKPAVKLWQASHRQLNLARNSSQTLMRTGAFAGVLWADQVGSSTPAENVLGFRDKPVSPQTGLTGFQDKMQRGFVFMD